MVVNRIWVDAPWCAPLTITEANLVHSMIVDGMKATRKLREYAWHAFKGGDELFDQFMEFNEIGADLSAHAGV